MSNLGLFSLLSLGFSLGLRHGIDWDHIVAITDITGSTVTIEPDEDVRRSHRRTFREGFFLATMYALGHGSLVITLGLLALWLGAVLPDWLDSIMERMVGITLIILGGWIFYSICRHGRSFQLRSRWMMLFALAERIGNTWKSKIMGQPLEPAQRLQYGPKTAFGIGIIHGIGAETGSQALLLATVAGATTKLTASLLLFSFTIGLLLSNLIVAAFSLTSFVSASSRKNIYFLVGILAGIFSLVIGICFVIGQGTMLPTLLT
jgi:high-affinity nickel permease